MKKIEDLILSIFLAFFVEGILILGFSVQQLTIQEIIKNFNFLRLCVFLCFMIGCWAIAQYTKYTIGELLFQYRYIFALMLLFTLVLLDISGSSIGMWNYYLPNGMHNGVLWGEPVLERSDEWATYTPLNFSSFMNHSGMFAYFNTTARGSLTDSFIVYGQPVKDIVMIFRPFQIGYLFLGMSRGLSFYWWSRFIALFLSTLEIGLLMTKKNKRLSVLFAVLVSCSPVVHWWTSVNSLIEMIVAGNCFILMINAWINNTSIIRRSIYAIVMGICGGCYVLSLYPAWMVPLAYFYLVLFIWILYEKRKEIYIRWKDMIPLMCFLIVFVGGIFYIFLKSQGTIELIFNSAYPGKRESFGGFHESRLYSYTLSPYVGISKSKFVGPACEFAGFIDLHPIGFLLAIYTLFYQKKKDLLLGLLFGFGLLLTIFIVWEMPPFLAKITLLSWSVPYRVFQMSGIFQIAMIIRVILLSENNMKKITAVILSTICVIVAMYHGVNMQQQYWRPIMIIVSSVVLWGLFFCILQSKKELWQRVGIWIWGLMSVFSIAVINPIQKGIDVIYENELIKEIKTITDQDPEGKWIVDNTVYPMMNVPILVGAPTINSTNVYPNLDLWSKIDVDGSYEEMYNRYAHIMIKLTKEEKTEFSLIQADLLDISMNIQDAKKLKVKYILTNRNLEEMECKLLSNVNEYYIYQLID